MKWVGIQHMKHNSHGECENGQHIISNDDIVIWNHNTISTMVYNATYGQIIIMVNIEHHIPSHTYIYHTTWTKLAYDGKSQWNTMQTLHTMYLQMDDVIQHIHDVLNNTMSQQTYQIMETIHNMQYHMTTNDKPTYDSQLMELAHNAINGTICHDNTYTSHHVMIPNIGMLHVTIEWHTWEYITTCNVIWGHINDDLDDDLHSNDTNTFEHVQHNVKLNGPQTIAQLHDGKHNNPYTNDILEIIGIIGDIMCTIMEKYQNNPYDIENIM